MNDNDVPDMPDRPESKITADDYAQLRELSKTSDITHRVGCLATSPGGGDPGWEARRRYARRWAPFKEAG
jgi:hypothetical protein